jgi:hypothetical protein
VDVCPENNKRNDEPNIKIITVGCENEDENEGGDEEVREASGPDIDEGAAYEQRSAGGKRGQGGMGAEDAGGVVNANYGEDVYRKFPVNE